MENKICLSGIEGTAEDDCYGEDDGAAGARIIDKRLEDQDEQHACSAKRTVHEQCGEAQGAKATYDGRKVTEGERSVVVDESTLSKDRYRRESD